jgi:uncharacterized membrane protein YdjX (TVP38/TMEM64 family)
MKSKISWRLIIIVSVLAAVILILRLTGLTGYLSLKNVQVFNAWMASFGYWAPLIYILLYIAWCVFLLPGLIITIAGGLLFGSLWGTVYVSIGSTLGASAAFLIARYAARSMVELWLRKYPYLRKIDEGVEHHGWRMLMITRLVPLFPFTYQNFVYGLTKIRFSTYVLVSWVCMLPGTAAYVFAAGSLASGEGNIKKTLWYLGIAAVFLVVVSLIPYWIRRRYPLT